MKNNVILSHYMESNPYDGSDSGGGYVSSFAVGVFADSQEDLYTPEIISEFLFRHVMGCVFAETDSVRRNDRIVKEYVNKALDRLDSSTPTGLVPSELNLLWYEMSENIRSAIRSTVRKAADDIMDFPDFSSMNSVYINTRVLIDFEIDDVPSLIPAVVETKKGMAGVVPSISGYDASTSALSRLSYPHSRNIPDIHVWDLHNMKISKSTKDEFLDILDA